uniref:Glutamate-rich WD repeat-containing protein 1 n=1 Tax=Photinus pyralis TaxID=7054 RepID=A0A1Y1N8J2_PHOPY
MSASKEECDEMQPMEEDNEQEPEKSVYLPGTVLEDGEELVCDPTAYVMLHQLQTGSPCLSFDVIPDNITRNEDSYPLTCYLVAGTQAMETHANNVIVMKLSNLHRTSKQSEEDDSDEEEEEEVQYPAMAASLIKHQGGINRTRCTALNGVVLAATWSELGRVNVWDLTQQLQAVNDRDLLKRYVKDNVGNAVKPLFTFAGHQQEGFAIDWNSLDHGVLATGDCKMDIHIWKPKEGGSWFVDQRPLIGHKSSVEDIQWSPNEPTVLASCSVDRSVRIWDIRAPPSKACMLTTENAHTSDVNVISWNRNEPFIVSGGDDGILNIWDLRRFAEKQPVATFKHHTGSITSVDWHPTDSAVFASSGSDDQITLWDLSVEKDDESEEIPGLPPQLLFIHQGQKDIKELHWHPQIPGLIISTALSDFNIFRTISI